MKKKNELKHFEKTKPAVDVPVSDDDVVEVSVDLHRLQQSLNSIYHKWIIRNPKEGNCSLRAFLIHHLPHIDPQSWDERAAWGGLHLMGKPAPLDTNPLPVPGWIEYFEPRESVAAAKAELQVFNPDQHILYEDDWIAVAFKPARFHTNPAREQQSVCLRHSLEEYFKGPVHLPSRLDFSTAGIILVSRHPDAHKSVQHLYQKRSIQKYYLLCTSSIPSWKHLTLSAPIGQDPRHPILRRLSVPEGKTATTKFQSLVRSYDPERALLLGKPYTGRTHQIRLHSAALGHRIIGDNFYNGAVSPALGLLCYALCFPHPKTQVPQMVKVPDMLLPQWVQTLISPEDLNRTLAHIITL